MKLLIVFDPDCYGPGSYCIPLLIPKGIDPSVEFERMLNQYPPNHCPERFEDWLRRECQAVDAKIDIFNTEEGCLNTNLN